MNREELSRAKEDIRGRLDIVSIVERYVNLKPVGSSYKGLCPFHKEKSPSFNVSPDKGMFHCFGCGKGGDLFSFIMEMEGLTFMEVLTQCAKEASVKLDMSAGEMYKSEQAGVSRTAVLAANSYAANFFYTQMKSNKSAIEYLKDRGLSGDTVKKFQVGFAPDEWSALIDSSTKNGGDAKLMVESGLAVASSKTGKPYDRFRNRIIFPIYDMAGRPVAFGGRTTEPDGIPKYLNSPETILYQKNRVFYGLYQARQSIKAEKSAIVVEGYMDALLLHQNGIENVVATCGTALTHEHGFFIRRFVEKVYLVFDGDSAGVQAARRAVENLFPLEIIVQVVILPQGEDPDSLVRAEGRDAFLELLKNAQSSIDFYIDILSESFDVNTPQGKSRLLERVAQLIGSVENSLTKSHYAVMIASRFSVDEKLFRSMINGKKGNEQPLFSNDLGKYENFLERALTSEEGSLIHYLISFKKLLNSGKYQDLSEIFSEPLFSNLYSLVISYADGLTEILNITEDKNIRNVLSLMLLRELPSEEEPENTVDGKIKKLKKDLVEKKKRDIQRRIASTTSSEKKEELLRELVELSKQNR